MCVEDNEIKIIDGKIYVNMGDVPNEPPTSCDKCEFYDGEGSFEFNKGCGGYETHYDYKCTLGEDRCETSLSYTEKAAKLELFKTCPIKTLT